MLLAKALQERKELFSFILTELSEVETDSQVEIGVDGKPTRKVDPTKSLIKASDALDKYCELVYRINKTNLVAQIDGKPMGELLARRDAMMKVVERFKQVANVRPSRGYVMMLDVTQARGMAKAIAAEIRQLDECIQQANWTVELET